MFYSCVNLNCIFADIRIEFNLAFIMRIKQKNLHHYPSIIPASWLNHLAITAALLLFACAVYRAAWIGDDAYITFRTADNFRNGFGLTWNVGERVQSFTHPLWMFTISLIASVTNEYFYTILFLSLIISLAAAALTSWWVTRITGPAVFGILILSLSNAYVDYSSSGLENPLTHLLLVVFYGIYFRLEPSRTRLWLLSFVFGLTAFNRQDAVLLLLPAMAFSLLISKEKSKYFLFLTGLTPLLAWHIFSLLYYGFLFPNTAYAKLHLNIPVTSLVMQGAIYFMDSLQRDPVTLWFTAAGIAVGLTAGGKPGRMAVMGIVFYLLYVLRIGGDFMSGRFFTAPLLISVILLGQMKSVKINGKYSGLPILLLLVLEFSSPARAAITPGVPYPANVIGENSIADERRFYEPTNGIWWRNENPQLPNHPWRYDGENSAGQRFSNFNNIGMYGFYAGPGVYIVDNIALADPFLARMPVVPGKWRVGHYMREVPAGYFETIQTGKNQIEDSNLALYYDALSLIIHEEIFTQERLSTIWKMNTGQYDHYLHK
jgi:arabinofuranosyltransferase